MAMYTKNVRHYSRTPPTPWRFCCDWWATYVKVKKITYERYSGIGSLDKLTPGYTVLNEKCALGMRQKLGMQVVYLL